MAGITLIKRNSFRKVFISPPQPPFLHRVPYISAPGFLTQATDKGILYLKRLNSITRRIPSSAGKELIETAFSLAWRAHNGVFRKDGKTPYIEHPLQTAEIASEWGATPEIIAAALLHDTLEEGEINGERLTLDSLAAIVGLSVSQLVEGVTELGKESNYTGTKPSDINIYRKLLEHGQQNAAVFAIKLADRLHNMRTLAYLKPETREAKARETLYFYVPIADILGMWQVKRELEDLCFQYLPEEFEYSYKEIFAKRESIVNATRQHAEDIAARLMKNLENNGITAEIIIEQRSIFELYERMEKRQIPLQLLSNYDVWRINIIVEEKPICYFTQGIVHQAYPPIQEEIRDFIAVPRPNQHEFLQTYIITESGRLLIQIRTKEMQQNYRFGIVSKIGEETTPWLNILLNFLAVNDNPQVAALYETMGSACYPITVMSPTGKRYLLPRDATALDFARQIGEGCFLHAAQAIINSRPRPVSTPLKEGDIVFIETSITSRPLLSWLDHLHLPEALASLQRYFSGFPNIVIFALANHYLEEKTLARHLPFILLSRTIFFKEFLLAKGFPNIADFIQSVGQGLIPNINEIISGFFALYATAVHNYRGESNNCGYRIIVRDRRGLLRDIIDKISGIGINLSIVVGETISPQKAGEATITLVAQIVPGNIGVLQKIQIETIITRTPEKIRYESIDPKNIF